MENIVYLVTYDWQDPHFNREKMEEIFSNYEDAKRQFDIWVSDDKEDDEGGLGYQALHENPDFIIDTDEEDYYLANKVGYAALNYTEVKLEKRMVK